MPAVHAGDGVGVDGEGEVLVDAHVGPPDARGVGVGGSVRGDPALALERPLAALVVERDGLHQLALPLALVRRELPAPHVVAARDHVGAYAFGDPRADDEVAGLGLDAHGVAGLQVKLCGVARVNPERVGVRDLVEPLGVRAPCVNLHGQAEGRDEHGLAGVEVVRVDVALDVEGHGVLVPAPVGQRLRVELQTPARSGKAAQDVTVHVDADEATPLGVGVGQGHGHDVG